MERGAFRTFEPRARFGFYRLLSLLSLLSALMLPAAAAPAAEPVVEPEPAPALGWAQQIGGGNRDWVLDVAADQHGNVYVVGHFDGEVKIGEKSLRGAGEVDVFIAKFDAAGELSWVKRFGGRGQDEGRGVAVGADGRVYVTGFFLWEAELAPSAAATRLESAGSSDIFILCLDASGEQIWARRFGSKFGDVGYKVAVSDQGTIALTGYFQNTVEFSGSPGAGTSSPSAHTLESAGLTDAFVLTLDAEGRTLWARRFGGERNDQGRSVTFDEAGRIAVLGNFETTAAVPGSKLTALDSAGRTDIYTWHLDGDGKTTALRRFGGPGPDSGESITAAGDGSFYAAGTFSNTADFADHKLESAGQVDAFVLRLDRRGEPEWVRPYAGAGSDFVFGTVPEGDGALAVGFTLLPAGEAKVSGESRAFLSRLDGAGKETSRRILESSNAIQAVGIAMTPGGMPAVIGMFKGEVEIELGGTRARLPGEGKFDIFVSRLAADP